MSRRSSRSQRRKTKDLASSVDIEYTNPFKMPDDVELFEARSRERAERERQRKEMAQFSVIEKTTKSSEIASNRFKLDINIKSPHRTSQGRPHARFKGMPDEDDELDDEEAELEIQAEASKHERRREKENLADFIDKKRQMFHVQMSLNTKLEEIAKLEALAAKRDKELQYNEQMLNQDAVRFDTFLKDNDKRAETAQKSAELETKKKLEKYQLIKKLNSEILAIQSEISKYDEDINECAEYKRFLDRMTPSEWKKQQADLRAQRRQFRKEQAQLERDELRRTRRQERKARARNNNEEDNNDEEYDGEEEEEEEAEGEGEDEDEEEYEDEYEEEETEWDSDEELPLYFTEPKQLLNKFQELEERNLFLIVKSQETEEQLEDLKSKFKDQQERMHAETMQLEAQIGKLEEQIERENAKGTQLRALSQGKNKNVEKQEATLEELRSKVAEVYRACGAEEVNIDVIPTIQMLAKVETRLEELLNIIRALPEDEFKAAMRVKEKFRRQQLRKSLKEEERKMQEGRIKRALERAHAPVKKHVGKPVMFRSKPPPKRTKKKQDRDAIRKQKEEEEDIRDFFT